MALTGAGILLLRDLVQLSRNRLHPYDVSVASTRGSVLSAICAVSMPSVNEYKVLLAWLIGAGPYRGHL